MRSYHQLVWTIFCLFVCICVRASNSIMSSSWYRAGQALTNKNCTTGWHVVPGKNTLVSCARLCSSVLPRCTSLGVELGTCYWRTDLAIDCAPIDKQFLKYAVRFLSRFCFEHRRRITAVKSPRGTQCEQNTYFDNFLLILPSAICTSALKVPSDCTPAS